ncbi:MAG TPA: MotA/TolQ/ExbB proton channel family protein [Flavobacteriales bacterium]|nr:MotA/TolQ/ExbB proton channel family protein [Flavobacteriales bacterium]
MSNVKSGKANSLFVAIVFPLVLIISVSFYMFVLGDPANFQNNDPVHGHPIDVNPGKLYGTIYKGGFIVPILISINLIVLVFSVERFITLGRAKGKGRIDEFIVNVRQHLANDDVDKAVTVCNEQQGSVANVMRSGLERYKTVLYDATHDKETRLQSVKQELEEATALELPMLSKNMVILSTCASISTLVGLIGTVLGMIKAFSALATSGTPDATALSTGISEALINTALGITGSTLAIIFFNYFSNRIDAITHGIDEAGFSVSQTLANRK